MNTEDDEFARIAREQALNKMADNARELGLDYEPDIPFGDNNPGLQWDEVPQAFNDWWNADYDPTGNPFGKDTHAYWAWAGWKAAKQPAQQVLTPWSKALEDVWAEPDEASPPAQQCTGCEGNPKYPNNPCALCGCKVEQPAQQEPVEFKFVVIDNHHPDGITFEQWVKPAQQEPVACIIGTRGSAFDSPITKRAYTYKEQPSNAVASKLGRACNEAGKQRAGDNIDRGLGLLQELQNEGFGVFALGAEYTVTQQEPVGSLSVRYHRGCKSMTNTDFDYNGDLPEGDYELYTSPPAQRKPLMDVIKAAQGVLEWTEIAHRPPKRDRLEVGRMAMVRLHALADLHDALIAHGIKENT